MTTRTENENSYIIHDNRGEEFKGPVTFDVSPLGLGISLLQSSYKVSSAAVTVIGNSTEQDYTFVGGTVDASKWNSIAAVPTIPIGAGLGINIITAGIYNVSCRMTYTTANLGAGDLLNLGFLIGGVLVRSIDRTHSTALNWPVPELTTNFTGYLPAASVVYANFKWDDVSAGTATTSCVFNFEVCRIC